MFKCAIVGCGNIAGGYGKDMPQSRVLTHAGAYSLHPKTKLVAAADMSLKALKNFGKKWNVKHLYTDYESMIDTEDIDILSICLPAENHYEVFAYVCKKDIPGIWCEKPLAHNLCEARKMVEISNKKVVAVNYFRRWNPDIIRLRSEILQGCYGRVINVTVRYTKGIYVNGSHMVDLTRWFFGEPKLVNVMKLYGRNTKDPGADFTVSFANGVTAYFLNIPDAGYVFIDVDILTEKGRINIGQRAQGIELYKIVREPYYHSFSMLRKMAVIKTRWQECMRRALCEIIDCLAKNGKTSCTPHDGLRAIEICDFVVGRGKA